MSGSDEPDQQVEAPVVYAPAVIPGPEKECETCGAFGMKDAIILVQVIFTGVIFILWYYNISKYLPTDQELRSRLR